MPVRTSELLKSTTSAILKSLFPSGVSGSGKKGGFLPKFLSFPGFFTKRIEDRTIIEEGYMSNADYYSIIRKISDAARTIPILVIERDSRGEIINSESWENLLIQNPNSEDCIRDFIEKSITNLSSTGDCYLHFVGLAEGFDRPLTIEVIRSVDVEPQTNGNSELVNYLVNRAGGSMILQPEEIVHIKMYDPSTQGGITLKGLSPGNAGYNVLDASNELAVADAFMNKNKGAAGILVTQNGYNLDEDEAKIAESKINQQIGGAKNKNKIALTSADLKYLQIGMSPVDLQIQKSYVVKLRQLCNVLGVNSALFNDPENKRFNNLKEAKKELIVNAVLPLVDRIFSAIEKKLNSIGSNIEILPDLSSVEVLQEDQKDEAEKNKSISEIVKSKNDGIKGGTETRETAISFLVLIMKIPQETAEALIIQDIKTEE